MGHSFLDIFCNLAPLPVCTAALAVFLSIVYNEINDTELPPGPSGIPYLGYWPFLNNSFAQFEHLAKEYGSVFSFTIAGHLFINLGTIKAMKNAHITESQCFEGRGSDFNLQKRLFSEGLCVAEGKRWRVLRNYFLQCFKEYGLLAMNSRTGAQCITDSVNDTVKELGAINGEPVCIVDILTDKVTRIICRVLFKDNGLSPKQAMKINNIYTRLLKGLIPPSNLLLHGDIAQYIIFPVTASYREAVESHKLVKQYWEKIVERHESTFDGHQIRNIVDSYLKERNDRRLRGDPTAYYFTEEALAATLAQFVGNSINGVSRFIAIILQTLAKHPEEQTKVYEELLKVLGPEQQPTLEDKRKLPYLNAFIYETVRTTDYFPAFNPGLECIKETTVQGYRIPKGAITLMNTWLAHHDPDVYEDPYLFNPSRFLVTPGKRIPELPVVFGIGKRVCIGGAFSVMQVFLFLATLIKHFRLTLSTTSPADKTDDLFKSTNWKICAYPRTRDLQKKCPCSSF